MNEKELPLVSIVTPSLNQGQFIEQTILSIRRQDYRNLEHIIVDGGSRDNTLSVLRKHERTYNMRWISEPDNGMYQAINKGMKQAKGDILAYLNADDLYLPWTLRVVVERFYHRPSVDVVYGDMIYMPMLGECGFIIFNPPEQILRTHLRLFGSITQPTVFWRRRVLESLNQFDEGLQIVGDYDFWIRAARSYRFLKVDEVLAIERAHQQKKSLRSIDDLRQEEDRVKARHYGRHSIKVSAERILYALLWSRYNAVRVFMLCPKWSSKSREGGGWRHFLGTRVLSRLSPRELCITFTPGLTVAVKRRKPDFRQGYVDVKRLVEIALRSDSL